MTTIDNIFEKRRAAEREMLRTDFPPGTVRDWKLPRLDTLSLLEDPLRRRARFVDADLCGPRQGPPYATPRHLKDTFNELAALLAEEEDITKHRPALERAAYIAGYRDWDHVGAEARHFEATAGRAYEKGLVVLVTMPDDHPHPGFTKDPALLFLAANQLVGEYATLDVSGDVGVLPYPAGSGLSSHMVRSAPLFLRAVGANYYDAPSRMPGVFLRFDGDSPSGVRAALDLCKAALNWEVPADFALNPNRWDARPKGVFNRRPAVHYLWLRGEMLVVSPLWDD
jgi:hypothetical protein